MRRVRSQARSYWNVEGMVTQQLLGFPGKRRLAAQHSVQNAPKGIKVGCAANIVTFVLNLLGRHVAGRSRASVRSKLKRLRTV